MQVSQPLGLRVSGIAPNLGGDSNVEGESGEIHKK
jgi:hypothetical protein